MGEVIEGDFSGRDPVLKAGTSPLPYVQVGMLLRPLSSDTRWEVTSIDEDANEKTLVRLLMSETNAVIVRFSASVRAEWMLAEDFDPNGCGECGCTSKPCGCAASAELEEAREAVGKGWTRGGVSLASAIKDKCRFLERLAGSDEGWSPRELVRLTKHGAMVVTIDGDKAIAMFREQVDGACVEHELLNEDGSAWMPVDDAIRTCDELVEDLEAGLKFDRSYGRTYLKPAPLRG